MKLLLLVLIGHMRSFKMYVCPFKLFREMKCYAADFLNEVEKMKIQASEFTFEVETNR